MFLATSVKTEENVLLYTVRYTFSSDPLYTCSTVQPFSIFMNNALFKIYTPLNIEAQLETWIPLAIRVYTHKTYDAKAEYDYSMFEVDNDEIMVNKYGGYEYFMLKPVNTGLTVVKVHFRDMESTTENAGFSIPFLINIKNSSLYQIVPYVLLIITVLSLMYISVGKNFFEWLLHRHGGRKL